MYNSFDRHGGPPSSEENSLADQGDNSLPTLCGRSEAVALASRRVSKQDVIVQPEEKQRKAAVISLEMKSRGFIANPSCIRLLSLAGRSLPKPGPRVQPQAMVVGLPMAVGTRITTTVERARLRRADNRTHMSVCESGKAKYCSHCSSKNSSPGPPIRTIRYEQKGTKRNKRSVRMHLPDIRYFELQKSNQEYG